MAGEKNFENRLKRWLESVGIYPLGHSKLAYEVFTEAVDELEKKQNTFKTIVVDLLEDVYRGINSTPCEGAKCSPEIFKKT